MRCLSGPVCVGLKTRIFIRTKKKKRKKKIFSKRLGWHSCQPNLKDVTIVISALFFCCCCRRRRRLFCYYHAGEYGDLMMSSENYRLYEEESIRFRLAGSQTTRSPSDGVGIRVETKGEERMKKWEKRKTRWSCACVYVWTKSQEEEREIVSHYSFSDFPLLPMMQFFFYSLGFLFFRCLSGPPSTPPTHPLLATAIRRDTLWTNRYIAAGIYV